mgnify:CR=1 FL=1
MRGGRAGLVKFRQTQAEFKNFKVGPEVTRLRLPAAAVGRVVKAGGDAPPGNDATLVEVNPLVKTGDGTILALDGKVSLDANAAFRHSDWSLSLLHISAPTRPS